MTNVDNEPTWELLATAPFFCGKPIPQNPKAELLTMALQAIYETPSMETDPERATFEFSPILGVIPTFFEEQLHQDFVDSGLSGCISTHGMADTEFLMLACVRIT